MKIRFFLLTLFISGSIYAQHSDWIVVASAKTHKETVDALERAILDKGFTVFDIIDHATGAERVGLNLNPTTVIIFGNPKAGTALMKCDQQMGIILPLRILVWEDENAKVNAGFIDPEKYLKEFTLDNCKESISKMKLAMKNLLSSIEKK
jgi:uncharacterized protein (DUF302 family)